MTEPFREDALLAFIKSHSTSLGPKVIQGPGDDLAVISFHGHTLLAGTDSVIEGVHFVAGTTPEAIGRKAVTRNLSDVAAMAARPVACLASCVLPRDVSTEFANRLVESVRRTALHFQAPLIGGDTALHRRDAPLTLCVTVLAEPLSATHPPVLRSGGRAGDRLMVTGSLGGSLLQDGTGKHLDFVPRLEEAESLLTVLGGQLHAMMDLSDGLAQDAARMATASNMQAVIVANHVPCNSGCDWQRAMSDGEDYELLFAIEPNAHVPAHLGRTGTPTCEVGWLRAMPTPTSPRLVCVVKGVETECASVKRFHDATTSG